MRGTWEMQRRWREYCNEEGVTSNVQSVAWPRGLRSYRLQYKFLRTEIGTMEEEDMGRSPAGSRTPLAPETFSLDRLDIDLFLVSSLPAGRATATTLLSKGMESACPKSKYPRFRATWG